MTTTKYIWDPVIDTYLLETDDNNATQVAYTVEPVHFGRAISQRRSSVTNYLHQDALGSTRQLTGAAKTITDSWLSDAFGSEKSHSGTTLLSLLWIGASGYHYDSTTQTTYVRGRHYFPNSSRWLSVDPLHFGIWTTGKRPQSSPLQSRVRKHPYHSTDFAYSLNAPTKWIDPSGLAPQDHHWFPQFGDRVGNKPPGQKFFDKLCCKNGINFQIDDYTTTLDGFRKGTAHHAVHYVATANYVDALRPLFDKAKDCCELITFGLAAMTVAWNYLQSHRNEFSPAIPKASFPPLHPYNGNKNTGPQFFATLAQACGPRATLDPVQRFDACMYWTDESYRTCEGIFCFINYSVMRQSCVDALNGALMMDAARWAAAHPGETSLYLAGGLVIGVAPEIAAGVAAALGPEAIPLLTLPAF